jgi:hypothetical protein
MGCPQLFAVTNYSKQLKKFFIEHQWDNGVALLIVDTSGQWLRLNAEANFLVGDRPTVLADRLLAAGAARLSIGNIVPNIRRPSG